MWKLGQTAKETSSRPSALLCLDDPLTAYQFDAAVITLVAIVSNALSEMVEVGFGKDKRREQRYTLEQLLDPAFRLPRPPRKARVTPMSQDKATHQQFLSMAQQPRSGVKMFTYVGPKADKAM